MLRATVFKSSAHTFHCSITLLSKWHAQPFAGLQLGFRNFSVSLSSQQAHVKDGAESRIKAQRTAYSNPVRPTAIWLLPTGAPIDAENIIQQLPSLCDHARSDLKSATFLVTPRFAHLFEPDSNFLASAVNHIWSRPSLSRIGQKRMTYVAIVDAVPAINHDTLQGRPEIYGYEGLAFMLSPHVIAEVDKFQSEDTMPLVSFASQQSHQKAEDFLRATYSAPVANTLFVNGRKHTMFRETWTNVDQKLYLEHERQYLSHLEFPLYKPSWKKKAPSTLNAKLFRLTRPAVIVSSMGNIMREIQTKDGKVIPASHELEQILPPRVKSLQAKRPTSEVRVFAFVYPPNPVGRTSFNPYQERIYYWQKDGKLGLRRDQLQSMLLRGARLYRVTSGGAGWGKKAGLLSLEPNVQLNANSEPQPSFFPGFEFEDIDTLPGSTTLFPPGYIVQFLASWHDTEGTDKDGYSITDIPNDAEWLQDHYFSPQKLQKFCIGTTIQREVWGSPQDFQKQGDDEGQSQNPVFCPGRFGLLTTSAMSASVQTIETDDSTIKKRRHTEKNSLTKLFASGKKKADTSEEFETHSTLIEVPNSSFTATFSAGGEEIELSETAGEEPWWYIEEDNC